jgi:hypothetical protein
VILDRFDSDGHDKVAGELGHEPEYECALLCDTAIRLEREKDEVG